MISRRTFYLSVAAGVSALAGGSVFFRFLRRGEAQPEAGNCLPIASKADVTKWKSIEQQSVATTVFPLHPVEGQRYLVDALVAVNTTHD